MVKVVFKKIIREYVFTEKELKDKLLLDGEIKHMCLYSGRSPKQEEEGVTTDKNKWSIISETEEVEKYGRKNEK